MNLRLIAVAAASAAAGAGIAHWHATRLQVITAPSWQAVYKRTLHSHLFRLYEETEGEPRTEGCATARRNTIDASGLRPLGEQFGHYAS